MEYFQSHDWAVLMNPKSMGQCAGIALKVLRRMARPVAMVCGPLTTGSGRYARNLVRLRFAVVKLRRRGISVFDSSIFEESIRQFAKGATPQERSLYAFQNFYGLILRTGRIRKLYFLPDWEKSVGAVWMRRCARRLGLAIEDVEEGFFPEPKSSA